MGITGEIVRNVFSKSRSVHQRHDQIHGKNNSVEKKRWSSSVRSYLCGDQELNSSILAAEDSASVRGSSVAEMDELTSLRSSRTANTADGTSVYMAEEDTASLRSSEATVNQPVHVDLKGDEEKKLRNSAFKKFQQEDAALIIQSAFRSFRAKRESNGEKMLIEGQAAKVSPSRESVATSVEVQTGNSSDVFSIQETESFDLRHPLRRKTRSQVLKLQDDWDDSTVSSVIVKMRMQNRLEAATRRERALAYAFSQQLRICSKKKPGTTNSNETDIGWTWLERWMASRQPENTLIEDQISSTEKTVAKKRYMEAALEEKESCGSNEVSSLFELNIVNVPKHVPGPAKTRINKTRNLSRQNSSLSPKESKDMKKVGHSEDEKDKRKRAKQPGNKKEIKHKEATTQTSVGLETEQSFLL